MSALGGALSLYLGISIVMAAEIVELIIDLIMNSVADKNVNRKNSNGMTMTMVQHDQKQ